MTDQIPDSNSPVEGVIKPLDYRSLLFRQVDRVLAARSTPATKDFQSEVSFLYGADLLQALVSPYLDEEYHAKRKASEVDFNAKYANAERNQIPVERINKEEEKYLLTRAIDNVECLMGVLHRRGLLLETPTGDILE